MEKRAKYICPVCRTPVSAPEMTSLNAGTHIRLMLVTLAVAGGITFVAGTQAGLKSLLFYLVFWAAAELWKGLSVRDKTRCTVCDFDPMLYQRDWRAARRQVETKLSRISMDLQVEFQERLKRHTHYKEKEEAKASVEVAAPKK
jgi:hypothetical protein